MNLNTRIFYDINDFARDRFPSDHAVMAGAVTAGLWLVHRRLGALAALAAVVMAFARVYIAAHYPQDVPAGLALGAVISLAGYVLVRKPLHGLLTLLARTPPRVLLTSSTGHPSARPGHGAQRV